MTTKSPTEIAFDAYLKACVSLSPCDEIRVVQRFEQAIEAERSRFDELARGLIAQAITAERERAKILEDALEFYTRAIFSVKDSNDERYYYIPTELDGGTPEMCSSHDNVPSAVLPKVFGTTAREALLKFRGGG